MENRDRLSIGLGRNKCNWNQSYRENDKWRPGLEREKCRSESEKLEMGRGRQKLVVSVCILSE